MGYNRSLAPLEIEPSGKADIRPTGTHAVTLLTIYVILLMYIPSALVLAPLGGAASPATMLAAAQVAWYVLLWLHPTSGLDRGSQPVRLAAHTRPAGRRPA